ncbi:hypothetical protein PZA11_007111 [Diplocarpon coronariae]
MSENFAGVTRGAQVTGVAVCSLCLTWISFSLRLYVRMAILKFVGREDWLTVAAMIVFTIFCSLCLRATFYGLGAHMVNIEKGSLERGFQIIFICELLYVVATTVTKIAIGGYFLRLSSKRYQRMTVYVTLAVVMIFSTMYFFFLLFQCGPISYLWTKYTHDRDGRCLSSSTLSAITYAHCAMSAITDWAFGILPIFFVWRMQMDPRTKFSVILILSLGFFASTATIVRIVYIQSLTATSDYAWEGINLVKWSMVEPAIAITAMNIATLRPLFQNLFSYASQRFESPLDGDGAARRQRLNSVAAKEYSTDFANLLGLSRVGVTTHISAGIPDGTEKDKRRWVRRKRGRSRKRARSEKQLMERGNESQTELTRVDHGSRDRNLSRGPVNWESGIQTTTVITSKRS